ncbi:Coniferyl alcohol acyltransferase [Linum grandiflorum]
MVKAATLTSLYQTLPLSNLDLLSGRFPVTYLYLYPNLQNIHLPTILTSLRRSLAKTLHYYYPFSGRIVTNPATSEPEIICNNQGVLFVEASANVTLKRVNFYDLNKLVMQGKLVSLSPDIPFQVQANVDELEGDSLAKVAGKVHEAISEATREEHFLEVMDWIECHRPGLMMARIVLGGGGGPAVVVSSGRRFPVGELEFGFGRAVLGTVSSTIDKIGVGYFNQRESGKNDGCWTVSAILWPQLVEALESDSVFHPISVAQHLLL